MNPASRHIETLLPLGISTTGLVICTLSAPPQDKTTLVARWAGEAGSGACTPQGSGWVILGQSTAVGTVGAAVRLNSVGDPTSWSFIFATGKNKALVVKLNEIGGVDLTSAESIATNDASTQVTTLTVHPANTTTANEIALVALATLP